ncbi:MAG TPA: tyrosine-type recombinase/integrase [Opitutaceae bacterium]|jgi:integrase|nr:tyrosine-type recombinase/integrase [Opitutaceae bacterium]
MASVRRKDRSPYYFACFYDENGNAKCISTKSKNKKEALRIANEWESAWQKKVTTSQAKVVLNDILEMVGAQKMATKTVGQLFDEWLAEKKDEVSPGSFDQYTGVLKNARIYLGKAVEKDVRDVSRFDIIAARTSIAEAISPSAANKMLDHLRMVFKYAVDNELIDRSPMVKIKNAVIPEGSKGTRRGLTLPEVRRLLAIVSPLWRGLILVGLYTGQRLGDVVRLQWGHLVKEVVEGSEMHLISVRTRKTKRWVRIPAAPPLLNHLLSIRPSDPEPSDPVFPAGVALLDKKGRVARLSNQFYDHLVLAGLAPKRQKANTGNGHSRRRKVNALSFHCLRHAATSLLKAAGVPQAVVMDIIGHESPEISAIYTHIDDATKCQAINKIEDVTK